MGLSRFPGECSVVGLQGGDDKEVRFTQLVTRRQEPRVVFAIREVADAGMALGVLQKDTIAMLSQGRKTIL